MFGHFVFMQLCVNPGVIGCRSGLVGCFWDVLDSVVLGSFFFFVIFVVCAVLLVCWGCLFGCFFFVQSFGRCWFTRQPWSAPP